MTYSSIHRNQRTQTARIAGALALVLVASCSSGGGSSSGGGGGGAGGGGGGGSAPADLTYPNTYAIYMVGVEAAENVPTYTGSPTTWSVSPALPAGLRIDPADGSLEGTPAAPVGRDLYTITASNDAGEASSQLTLQVVFPPRFAYVSNADDTLSILTLDPVSGALTNESFLLPPANQRGPRDVTVHPTGRWLYVPNATTHNVSVYDIDATTGRLTARTPVAGGLEPEGMAVTPDGRFAFVTNKTSGDVYAYTIDQATGDLDQIGPARAAGLEPAGITVHPSGDFVYVTNKGSNDVSIFAVAADGSLSADAGPTSVPGNSPNSIAIDPQGHYAYVLVEGSDQVVPYTIDQGTGELVAEVPSKPTGTFPSHVAVHPTGRFTYVTNASSSTTTVFDVDVDTGDLVEVGVALSGTFPFFLDFDPSGGFAYVVGRGSKDLTVYEVDVETGLLEARSVSRLRDPLFVDMAPGLAPVERRAEYAYALNGAADSISQYRVDPLDGDLTWISDRPTGPSPLDLAVSPNDFVYVVHDSDGLILAFEVDELTGELNVMPWFEILNSKLTACAVDPSGRYLVVTGVVHQGGNPVERLISLAIDNFGGLTLRSSIIIGEGSTAVAFDPTGQFVTVSSGLAGEVSAYRLSPENGTFLATDAPETPGGAPADVAFDGSGRYVYAPLGAADTLVGYEVDGQTGALAPNFPGMRVTGTPLAMAFHPAGHTAYVAVNDPFGVGNITLVNVDSVGALSEREAVLSGLNPRDLVLSPDGSVLYVVNEGSQDVSVLSVDPAGGLTPRPSAPAGAGARKLVLVRRVQ